MPSVLSSVGGALAGGLASSIFGGGRSSNSRTAESALLQAPIRNITTPGFSTTLNGNNLTFTRGRAVDDVLGTLSRVNDNTKRTFQSLRNLVTPGEGRLTDATRSIFTDARSRLRSDADRSVGNLRSDLARRRILGSSFANDAIDRRLESFREDERSLDVQESAATASNFLQELDASRQLLQDMLNTQLITTQTELNQLNVDSQLASAVSGNLNSVMTQGAQTIAQLEADRAAGRGAFFQPVVDSVSGEVSDFIEDLF